MRERNNLEWKHVEGTLDWYVSNYGDFKRLERNYIDKAGRHLHYKERIFWSEELSFYGGSDGKSYLGINIGKKKYAHRIVAETFISNPNNLPQVNHKDGNTKNNYAGCLEKEYKDSNLEWVTPKENMRHASMMGLINCESELRKKSAENNRNKINYEAQSKAVVQLDLNGVFITEYKSVREASENTGCQRSQIIAVCKKKYARKSSGGYLWVYKDEYDPNKKYSYFATFKEVAKKPVLQFTLEGQLIAEYESIQEACRKNKFNGDSYISEVCKGRRKQYKGYVWKYKNE